MNATRPQSRCETLAVCAMDANCHRRPGCEFAACTPRDVPRVSIDDDNDPFLHPEPFMAICCWLVVGLAFVAGVLLGSVLVWTFNDQLRRLYWSAMSQWL